ncbi:thiamine-phosphate kinase [Marinobacter confluentis]|uniref:Thiamine-monophosphate kinase n=1 Tax=Marinobacter confluentis TaxID=1697557 RepID=A0A4Z1BN78_9GAMM|nr:thiamine-phosphate kinase [Marinobacter confluentis]TGN38468.1 thiamine-phosphate kinase [Marinobacter confluentis]
MGEFDLIRRYFLPVANAERHPSLVLGPGDDCAIQRVDQGQELVFSVDTLVEGVHFPANYPPEKLARRSLAVAASDLAAMGAEPVCFTLALTLPKASTDWLKAFSAGLATASREFGLSLAGGDTTRGPLSLTLQVHGTVPIDGAIKRSGAQVGDLVCVSGTLGDAGAALSLLDQPSPTAEQAALLARYHSPQPRLALGKALRGYASAAIDISDGLVADLGHLLEASGAGGVIDTHKLPLSDALTALRPDALQLALNAGDDYELCFTISEPSLDSLNSQKTHPEAMLERLTVIGRVREGPGLSLDGVSTQVQSGGYDHFGSQ